MKIWLRYQNASSLESDQSIVVSSHAEWRGLIEDLQVVSSILWPEGQRYPVLSQHIHRRHLHEIKYKDNPARNLSFLSACRKLSEAIDGKLGGSRCLVYAPLREALPIWRGIRQFIENVETIPYYPVTSSFLKIRISYEGTTPSDKGVSGRYNNIKELKRIRPFLNSFDYLLYVDEIVSGGMMKIHLHDMFQMRIHEQIPIVAVGLADYRGEHFLSHRAFFDKAKEKKRLSFFIWEGCDSLITEDQKFLQGTHYSDYAFGAHVIPVIDDSLEFYPEKKRFDEYVYSYGRNTSIPDAFAVIVQTKKT